MSGTSLTVTIGGSCPYPIPLPWISQVVYPGKGSAGYVITDDHREIPIYDTLESIQQKMTEAGIIDRLYLGS